MNLKAWLIEYKKISTSLPLNFKGDLTSAKTLNSLISRDDSPILKLLNKKPVIIFANTKYLERDILLIKNRLPGKNILIAVDGAVKVLLKHNLIPHINITDLDGDSKAIAKANRLGSITVVHAHGDNIGKIKELVPLLNGRVVATTQTKPFGKIHNFYGFTDGDRAVSLACCFKAKAIGLFAFKFYKSSSIKAKKLQVGKQLIEEYAKTYPHIFDIGITGSNLLLPKKSLLEFEKLLKNK